MTENPNTPQSPYGGYGSAQPQQPVNPPQSPYSVPQQQPQAQAPYGAPQAQTPPPVANPYQNPYKNQQQAGGFPAVQKPLVLETAYAYLCFLGFIGGHKFYLRQTMQGVAYLGAWILIAVLSGVVGSFIGFLGWLAIAVAVYADIRTMKEQVDRSNNGEVFPVPAQVDFIKKAFNKV